MVDRWVCLCGAFQWTESFQKRMEQCFLRIFLLGYFAFRKFINFRNFGEHCIGNQMISSAIWNKQAEEKKN